jgi:hypothetical protein
LVLSPAPVAVTPETVTFPLPVFVSVAFNVFVLPTVTLPKFSAFAFEVRAGVDAATALPLAAIISGEFGASLNTAIEPLAFPTLAGEKMMLKLALCPAAMYVGIVSPLTLNPAPFTLACEIVACAVPLFDMVIVCELLEPATTF